MGTPYNFDASKNRQEEEQKKPDGRFQFGRYGCLVSCRCGTGLIMLQQSKLSKRATVLFLGWPEDASAFIQ
jgi:hypothetical protein